MVELDVHQALWRRIRDLRIGPPDVPLPFERRLARENGWSVEHAVRVVSEYKRFLLLAAVSDRPLTPSDAIDQAWHLHLAYTHSYWDELCGEILGRPLHHGPTRGGASEGRKFERWYEHTLRRYEEVFGGAPPPDLLPSVAARFAGVDGFRRVDTTTHLVVRWPRVLRGARGRALALLAALVVGAGGPLACGGCGGSGCGGGGCGGCGG